MEKGKYSEGKDVEISMVKLIVCLGEVEFFLWRGRIFVVFIDFV